MGAANARDQSDAATPRDKAKPGLTAIDPSDGKILWQVPAPRVPCSWAGRCLNAQSAPPTVIPGVVFAGGHDGWLRAYVSETGRTLWMFDSAGRTYETTNGVKGQKGGSFDHSGFVVSGGAMYAVSGYNGATGAYGNPLNVLLAFSVDGK